MSGSLRVRAAVSSPRREDHTSPKRYSVGIRLVLARYSIGSCGPVVGGSGTQVAAPPVLAGYSFVRCVIDASRRVLPHCSHGAPGAGSAGDGERARFESAGARRARRAHRARRPRPRSRRAGRSLLGRRAAPRTWPQQVKTSVARIRARSRQRRRRHSRLGLRAGHRSGDDRRLRVRTARLERAAARSARRARSCDRCLSAGTRALARPAYADIIDWEPGAIEADRLAEIRDEH